MVVSRSNLAGRVAFFGTCALGLLLLASVIVPDDTQATVETPRPAPSMGSLEGRDYRIELEASPDGPRYTIIAASGEVLASSISPEEAKYLFPDVDFPDIATGQPREVMWVDPLDY